MESEVLVKQRYKNVCCRFNKKIHKRIHKRISKKDKSVYMDLCGFYIEPRTCAFAAVIMLFAVIMLGKCLYLETRYIVIAAAAWMIGLPFFIRNLYAILYEQKRFREAKAYMENILFAFLKRQGKILTALEDVLELYEPGRARSAIEDAITFIRRGSYDDDLYKEALSGIEAIYGCDRMKSVHDYMISVEFSGGEFERQAELLIADNNEWEVQVLSLWQAKKAKIMESYGAMLLGILCCVTVLFLQQKFLPEEMGIAKLLVTQLTSCALLVAELFLALLSQRKLKTDWLAKNQDKKAEEGKKDYAYIKQFHTKKERMESILFSAPFAVGAVICAVRFHNFYVTAGLILLAYLMLHQHRLNYKLAFSRAKEQVRAAFPIWVTKMTLLLQTNNVQVAIAKSIADAPEILVPELEKLTERIAKEGGDVRSYLSFLSEFEDPDIRTTMQILYAISETGSADASLQLNNLTAANLKLKNEAEKIRHRNVLADMELVANAPMVVCAVKQFGDLAVFLLYSLPVLSSLYQ